jgi:MFS family permease
VKVTVKNETLSEDETEVSLKPLYGRSVVNSLGAGMVQPFIGYYLVKLGASPSEMGWYQSSQNIANNVMQVSWGRLSDSLRRRVPFIVFGGFIVSALWIPMIFLATPSHLIILLAVQSLLGSMATPTWTALIGDLVPSSRLGRANASISLWATIGGLVATLASGIIMIMSGMPIQEIFFVPLIVATVLGIASALVMRYIREKKNGEKLDLKRNFTSETLRMLNYTRKSPDFMKYCYVEAVFQFFMAISWPLFSITQATILNASALQIALLAVVQAFVTIIFQGWAGRLADTAGRKRLMFLFRLSLVTVPLAYALSPDINALIVIGTFWGFTQAFGSASMTAYLLDVTPEEYRGSFAAVFNLIMGTVTFFGSLIGGYLSGYLVELFGLVLGLQVVYAVSAVGRGIGAALFLTLKETLKRQSPKNDGVKPC